MPDSACTGIDRLGQPGRRAIPARGVTAWPLIAIFLSALMPVPRAATASDPAVERFGEKVQPILEEYCSGCHANGIKKGGVDLDGLETDAARLRDQDLWLGVLRNMRAGIMPPAGKPRPSVEERRLLEDWIKFGALGIDPTDPDPGRVTVRRLNRIEYRNTIRDLIGVDYDTNSAFPPDDTGHGFDNIGEVLTLSPLLLEKYLAAATTIISRAVPSVPKVVPQKVVPGSSFRRVGESGGSGSGPAALSYYEAATVSATVPVEHDGRYRLLLDLTANERYADGVND